MISEINIKVFHGRENGEDEVDFSMTGDHRQIIRGIMAISKINSEFKKALLTEMGCNSVAYFESLDEIKKTHKQAIELRDIIKSNELGEQLSKFIGLQ